MNLERMKQGSQSERQNLASRRMVRTNLFTSSNGDADMENRLTDKGGEREEEGEMNGESSTDA